MDYSLQTFSIYRCCNDVNILWRPFYLWHQVQFFLEERVPLMSCEDREFQEQTTAEGSFIDFDTGVKLHYITLHYIMLKYVPNVFLYNQNHTIIVCFSIFVQVDRGILNCRRV